METARRENYDSGEDFVLEYGELRFTFNEADFSQRCEQAALKLGFVGGRLGQEELEDLVNLAVNGEILDPASALGEHVNDCWPELIGPAERSLVHWLRRLVFRGAWLDQRVKEGELSVAFDESTGTFAYVQPTRPAPRRTGRADRAGTRALLGPGRLPPLGRAPPGGRSPRRLGASRVARALRSPRLLSPTSSSARSVALAARSRIGWPPVEASSGSSAITVVSPPTGCGGGRDDRQRAGLAEVAGSGDRAAGRLRLEPVEAVDEHDGVAAAGRDPRPASSARSSAWVCESAEAAKLTRRDRLRRLRLPVGDLLRPHARPARR